MILAFRMAAFRDRSVRGAARATGAPSLLPARKWCQGFGMPAAAVTCDRQASRAREPGRPLLEERAEPLAMVGSGDHRPLGQRLPVESRLQVENGGTIEEGFGRRQDPRR